MARTFAVVAALSFSAATLFAQEPAAAPKSLKERVSYVVGLRIGQQMKGDEMDVDPDTVMRGFRDAMAGVKPALTEEEMDATFREFQKAMMAKEAAKALEANPELKAMAEKNAAEGKTYLEANAKKEGVTTLPSGLQYKVLKAGAGTSPKVTDTVQTHYKGTLLDGRVFDSSYDRGQPAVFGVGQVIAGWTEALQKMKTGDKWELYIPSDLAYGLRGSPPAIGPNSTLVFEVELIAIEPTLPEPKK